jgi:hypothetical protein
MKKTIFFVTTALPIFALASSEAYKAVITVYENNLDLITGKDTIVTSNWRNKGNQYDCSLWNPSIESVSVGVSFEQNQDCKQNQERDIEIYNVTSNGKRIFLTNDTEEQTISVNNKQSAIGSMDIILNQRFDSWSIWMDVSGLYDCDDWMPEPNSQLHGSTFTQSRNCSKDQERVRAVFDVWHSGKETKNRNEYEEKTINFEDSQIQIGLKDYILSTTVNNWSLWTNINNHYDCSSWSPNVSTIDYGESFTQTRDCLQNQERTRDIFDNWKVAGSIFNRTEKDEQIITEQESQSAIGTKNIIISVSYGSWSSWSNDGSKYSCGSYTPNVNTVNHGTTFTQTGTCKQNQEKVRDVFDVYSDGSKIKTGVERDNQIINISHSKNAVGTKDYIIGTLYGSWSSWTNSGNVHTCSSYSPNVNTVNHGTTFTQSRSCKQNQSRSRTVYNDWKVGVHTYKSTDTVTQTINVSQSRIATGTKDYIIGTAYGSWSSWSNSGNVYSCSSYSPSTGSVNHGTTFTQSRSCKQNQSRSRTVYNDWKVGSNTYKSTQTDSQTINVSQSRSATGAKDYIIGTVYGSWSGWSNDGGKYSCGSYSPSTGSVNHGTTFTQSRSCKQNQKRTRTLYNDWKVGSNTYKSTQTGTQTINVSQSRSATGTKDYIIGTVYGSWSGWSNDGGKYSCGSYTPATNTVNYGQSFTQTGSCKQNQKRTRALYNDWKVGSNTYKSTQTGTQTINVSHTRSATGTKNYIVGTVYGSWSSWSVHQSCYKTKIIINGSWEETYCVDKQKRTRTLYNDWKTGSNTYKSTQTEYRDVTGRFVSRKILVGCNPNNPIMCQ